ncbi:hypothetical protein [Nocardia nepalensis]|uniref:hypothetical protein n=1 Tax=Nocardia nepalensis TaxID=3375448 RepID=UPI003B6821ED
MTFPLSSTISGDSPENTTAARIFISHTETLCRHGNVVTADQAPRAVPGLLPVRFRGPFTERAVRLSAQGALSSDWLQGYPPAPWG